jgi:transcriptional antiterminator RfaH
MRGDTNGLEDTATRHHNPPHGNGADASRAASPDTHWYAIQSKPRQEGRAEANLAAGGIETFLPRVRPLIGERKAPEPEPLFPGYLFARFEPALAARKVLYARGVVKVLGCQSGFTPIDTIIVTEIQHRMDREGYVRLNRTFTPGERVRIVGGPLKGLAGVFEASTSPRERVTLLLSTISSQVRVLLDSRLVGRLT